MDVTVLISTWNNAKRLEITLSAFRRLFIPDGLTWQFIIVNNNCTDNTDKVIALYAKTLPILYLNEPVQGLSRARNAGLNVASGKLVIFTDDDVEPCKEWLKTYWHAFVENQSGQFWGGPVESEFEDGKPDDDLLAAAPFSVRGLDLGSQKRILLKNEVFISANWAAPLRFLKQAGAFDIKKGIGSDSTKLSVGEESDLMDRLSEVGLSATYLPDARIRHFVPEVKCTLEHILARCEASAFDGFDKYEYRLKSWIWFNKPIGLYIHILVNYIKYLAKKQFIGKYISAYIKFRVLLVVTKRYENNLRLRK